MNAIREFTATMRPLVGSSRTQLRTLLSDDFTCSHVDSLVEMEVLSVVARPIADDDARHYQAVVQFQVGDWPTALLVMYGHSAEVRGRIVARVPARLGWNVIVRFAVAAPGPSEIDLKQTVESDYHVVLRVSTRPF